MRHVHKLRTRNPHRNGLGRFMISHRRLIGGGTDGVHDADIIFQLNNGMVRENRHLTAGRSFPRNYYASRHLGENVVEEPLLPKQPNLADYTTNTLMNKGPDDIEALARLAGN